MKEPAIDSLTTLCLLLAAAAAPPPPAEIQITGVYSDLRQIEETGDILGTEVFLLYSGDGGEGRYHALVQFAEGVPEPPQLVAAQVQGTRVEFTATFLGDLPMRFRGEVTRDALRGEFEGPAGQVALPRGKSFWQ